MDAMTSDQYTELVGYLGRKFDGVDQNIEESRRHATVLVEQSQANLTDVAEGLGLRIDRVDGRLVGAALIRLPGSRPIPLATSGSAPGRWRC
jgi:hypothetical protein